MMWLDFHPFVVKLTICVFQGIEKEELNGGLGKLKVYKVICIEIQILHRCYDSAKSLEQFVWAMNQTSTRVSNLEKSREILTSLAPSRSKKLNFHSLSLLDFQDFEEKILFLFSIYENLKHKSRSLLDLDLEFSSGSVCVWN